MIKNSILNIDRLIRYNLIFRNAFSKANKKIYSQLWPLLLLTAPQILIWDPIQNLDRRICVDVHYYHYCAGLYEYDILDTLKDLNHIFSHHNQTTWSSPNYASPWTGKHVYGRNRHPDHWRYLNHWSLQRSQVLWLTDAFTAALVWRPYT